MAPGTSSCVSTAKTPVTAKAFSVRMSRMVACACGLRSVAPHSIPSIQRSEENANSPRTFSPPSGRVALAPTPLPVGVRGLATREPIVTARSSPAAAASQWRRDGREKPRRW